MMPEFLPLQILDWLPLPLQPLQCHRLWLALLSQQLHSLYPLAATTKSGAAPPCCHCHVNSCDAADLSVTAVPCSRELFAQLWAAVRCRALSGFSITAGPSPCASSSRSQGQDGRGELTLMVFPSIAIIVILVDLLLEYISFSRIAGCVYWMQT